MNTTFNDNDVAALLRIAGEVGELEPDVQARRVHILDRLLQLVGGCWAVCTEMERTYANDSGWAVPDSITVQPGRNFSVAGFGVCSVWMNIGGSA